MKNQTLIRNLKIIISASLFVFLFMTIFQPFGLNDVKENKHLIFIGYGIVSFLSLILVNIIFPSFFKAIFNELNWNVYKFLFWNLIMLIFIGVGNYLYSMFIFRDNFVFKDLLIFEYKTIAVGLFPLSLIILFRSKNSKLTEIENRQKLSDTNNEGEVLIFDAENSKNEYRISVQDLIFIQSKGNYLIFFKFDENSLKEFRIRATMSKLDELIAGSEILKKCHRSFVINTNYVIGIEGGSKKMYLDLKHVDFSIPVSRNFTAQIKSIYNNF